ncbi:MAG: hypothetical protein DWQ36_23810 [Acidobacteria bacterium]|nr:MAG: hypothetical protein DWQ30_07000 [Acidobacteriota bacterium]REK00180.1 MAG: hypothetical protein DWQ36_23810 [Acidobacteriota bacterium]
MIARRPPTVAAALAVCLLLAGAGGAAAERTHLLVISGLGGDPKYESAFLESALEIRSAALAAGLADGQVTVLTESPASSASVDGRSDRETVQQRLGELVSQSSAGDTVWVVLIGHGNFRDGLSKVNLPGPDLSDQDFDALLERLEGRRIVFVNTTSASGEFLRTLAGPDRVVITATKSAAQRNETLFGGFFADAFVGARADEDRDGRVSAVEAFRYAAREVARHYENENLLVTEQALLDDNGDGAGSAEPDVLGGPDGTADGALAGRLYLAASLQASSDDPEVAALQQRRGELRRQLEQLRRQKGSMPDALYLEELQRVLVEIAKLDRELRQREGDAAGPTGESR